MLYDLILKNGTIVTSEKNFSGDIAVSGGIIVKTGNLDISDTADVVYDAEGKYILPGIIDAHVHFRDPGLTEKEDFQSGSMAAAFGGITTVADMPNVIPVTSTAECFNQKADIAREKSYVDFALFALLNNDNFKEMEGLKNSGALGFKIFLGASTGDIAAPSLPVLASVMAEAANLDMRIGFHAETGELNSFYTELCKNSSFSPHFSANFENEGYWLSRSRPVFSEAFAIQTAICFAQYTGAKIHIHHITSADGVLLACEAKQKGINLTAETCPHYLFFDGHSVVHKVYPPIRDESHRKCLWEAIGKGSIDMVASDHAPHTAAEKALWIGEVPAGLSGVETFVPLFLSEVNKGALTLNDFVRLASESPAKIWGIYPQKGNIFPGADADFTIIDMQKTYTISADNLHSKSKTSPYDGMEVKGMPVATIVRGAFVMKDGILTGKKGCGKLVTPLKTETILTRKISALP